MISSTDFSGVDIEIPTGLGISAHISIYPCSVPNRPLLINCSPVFKETEQHNITHSENIIGYQQVSLRVWNALKVPTLPQSCNKEYL